MSVSELTVCRASLCFYTDPRIDLHFLKFLRPEHPRRGLFVRLRSAEIGTRNGVGRLYCLPCAQARTSGLSFLVQYAHIASLCQAKKVSGSVLFDGWVLKRRPAFQPLWGSRFKAVWIGKVGWKEMARRGHWQRFQFLPRRRLDLDGIITHAGVRVLPGLL